MAEIIQTVQPLFGANNKKKVQFVLIYDPQQQEILDFWAEHKLEFPRLYQLALIMLAIAPMSSRSERNFSISNALLSKKRASMCPERAHRVLLLHDNFDILTCTLNEE